jgi:hypothetical protein
MNFKFNINDRVKVNGDRKNNNGYILARYYIEENKTNGYLVRMDEAYLNPVFGVETFGMAVIEEALEKTNF